MSIYPDGRRGRVLWVTYFMVLCWDWFSGRDISEMFHDLVPKRALPDYYKVITHPMALNPVQVQFTHPTHQIDLPPPSHHMRVLQQTNYLIGY